MLRIDGFLSRSVRRLRKPLLNMPHDRPHQFPPARPSHSLGQMLIHQRLKRLRAATAIQNLRLERALVHLLEQRAEERLRHQLLRLARQLLLMRRQRCRLRAARVEIDGCKGHWRLYCALRRRQSTRA
jgi:hypothetical protein